MVFLLWLHNGLQLLHNLMYGIVPGLFFRIINRPGCSRLIRLLVHGVVRMQ